MGFFSIPLVMQDKITPAWNSNTIRWFILLSVGDAVNMAAFFGAMSKTTVAVAVLTHYFAPILVALFAPLVEGYRVRFAVSSAFLALVGLTLVLEPWNPARISGDVLAGALLGTLSACAYACNLFASNRLAKRIGAARTQGYHFFVSALLLAPFAFDVSWAEVSAKSLALVAAGSLIPGTFAGFIFVRSMGAIGSARAAILAYIEPLVAVVVGFVAFHETLPPIAFIGGALIILAGLVVSRSQNAT